MSSPEQAALLRDPDFRRYAGSRALSLLGSVITLIALPVLVYRLTRSPALTGTVAALEAAPYLLFGLVAGAVGDRADRRVVMITAELADAALVVSVPLAHAMDVLTVPHLLAVAFLVPAIAVFFDGAVFGALPLVVGRELVAHANSLIWSVQSLAEIVGPAAVGLALAVVHPATLMAVDAASYLGSAVLIAGIRRPTSDPARQPTQVAARGLVGEIKEGLVFLWRHAGIRTMTLVGMIQSVSGGGFVALMVVWADQQLGIGTDGLRFGLVYAAWAVGALIASLGLPRLLVGHSAAQIMFAALPFSVALGVVTALCTVWWVAGVSLLAWGIAYTLVTINSVTYRQQVTPEPLLGRVNTAGRMLAWGLGWTGGGVLAGGLAAVLDVRVVLVVMTGLAALALVVAHTSPLRHPVPATAPH